MFVLGFQCKGQEGEKTSGRSQKEGIKYREDGGMLPEEMMKPKNECQREREEGVTRGRLSVDGGKSGIMSKSRSE